MALAVIDEAIRNVVCVGADPNRVALLDNFSWGDPRRPSTLGELVLAVDGCVEGARRFGAPFVSGKDSLNNEYLGSDGMRHAVPPTLVITAVASVPNVDRTVTADLKESGNKVLLVGRSLPDFGASHVATVLNADPSPSVPAFDVDAPERYRLIHALIAEGLVLSCHDCAEGGAAVAVAEMAIAGRLGIHIECTADAHAILFGESLGRLLLEVHSDNLTEVLNRLPSSSVFGTVTTSPALTFPDGTSCSLDAAFDAWTTLP
jgi:phosphoribosylformylglycinamidine synthase